MAASTKPSHSDSSFKRARQITMHQGLTHTLASRALSALATLLIFCGASIASLVAAEFALRFALADVSTTSNMRSYFGKQWTAKNDQRNSWGFRERELAAVGSPDKFRIAVVGDSFTHGQGVPENLRFSNLMEEWLESSAEPDWSGYEVLNFGWPGADTLDEIAIAEKYVLPLEPDFMLLQWFVNDVEDHAERWNPLTRPLIPWPSVHWKLYSRSALYFLLDLQFSRLQQFAGISPSYIQYLLARAEVGAAVSGQRSAVSGQRSAVSGQRSEHHPLTVPMSRFVALARDTGIPVGVVLFPLFTPQMGTHYPLQALHDIFMEFCVQHQVKCLDLTPVYQRLGTQFNYSALWVNRFDNHPGERANEIAARAILEHFDSEFSQGIR